MTFHNTRIEIGSTDVLIEFNAHWELDVRGARVEEIVLSAGLKTCPSEKLIIKAIQLKIDSNSPVHFEYHANQGFSI